jgi:hypothetical protein
MLVAMNPGMSVAMNDRHPVPDQAAGGGSAAYLNVAVVN